MSHTVKILSRWDSNTLHEFEATNEQWVNGMAMRAALESAATSGANLEGADLEGAYLSGANLEGADLEGADLRGADLEGANLEGADLRGADLEGADLEGADLEGANLEGADLRGADLRGAYLSGAYLSGANLRGAYLSGAYLSGANLVGDTKLIGDRPVINIGPIGSRYDHLTAYITSKGLYLQAGCFLGTRDRFLVQLKANHGDNIHGQEYMAALALAEKHAELWEPRNRIEG